MTTTTTIAALCAAIDDGDDSLLPILADALEEAGDERAAGLRRLGDYRPNRMTPNGTILHYGWQIGYGHVYSIGQRRPRIAYLYSKTKHWRYGDWFCYPTRSAAFLALAAALMEGER